MHPCPPYDLISIGSLRAAAHTAASPRAEIAPTSTRAEINAFMSEVKRLTPATGTGLRWRLIFALDATASRQPVWDSACQLQADMFRETSAIGGLDVKLVYYRGRDECRASQWVSQPERLAALMERIRLPHRIDSDRQGHCPCQAGDSEP